MFYFYHNHFFFHDVLSVDAHGSCDQDFSNFKLYIMYYVMYYASLMLAESILLKCWLVGNPDSKVDQDIMGQESLWLWVPG